MPRRAHSIVRNHKLRAEVGAAECLLSDDARGRALGYGSVCPHEERIRPWPMR